MSHLTNMHEINTASRTNCMCMLVRVLTLLVGFCSNKKRAKRKEWLKLQLKYRKVRETCNKAMFLHTRYQRSTKFLLCFNFRSRTRGQKSSPKWSCCSAGRWRAWASSSPSLSHCCRRRRRRRRGTPGTASGTWLRWARWTRGGCPSARGGYKVLNRN